MNASQEQYNINTAIQGRRWAAVAARRPESGFFYGVKTTGIFCRPGCRSKRPARSNVVFFDSIAAAVAQGYRPCKRCQPQGANLQEELQDKVARACRLLSQSEPVAKLATVARAVGMSPFHFHRRFKAALGLTPKQYQAEHRLERFRAHLRQSNNITSAIYEAGFGSASRAYEKVSDKLGMSPGQYRNRGKGLEIFYDFVQTALGLVLVATTDRGVCALALGEKAAPLLESLRTDFPSARLERDIPRLSAHIQRIKEYALAPARGLTLPLDLAGTAFQHRVWTALRKIPAGQTVTYQDLARRAGKPKAVRAVASACAANKVALGVPCHRAVRTRGSLGGYRWGLARKQALLNAERC